MQPTPLLLTLFFAFRTLASPAAIPEPHSNLVAREESNVLVDKVANFLGNSTEQANLVVTINQCRNVPTSFIRQISAISPNGILTCNIYDGALCTGDSRTVSSRINDLATINFDNRMVSLNCTRK